MFSSINGVGPGLAQHAPRDLVVGEFQFWISRVKFGNHGLPVLASVSGSVQFAAGTDFVAGIRVEEKRILDTLITLLLGSH